jgi:hypothetical protein
VSGVGVGGGGGGGGGGGWWRLVCGGGWLGVVVGSGVGERCWWVCVGMYVCTCARAVCACVC